MHCTAAPTVALASPSLGRLRAQRPFVPAAASLRSQSNELVKVVDVFKVSGTDSL